MGIIVPAQTVEKPVSSARRSGDGGVYLVVAEDSDDFIAALNYVTHLARVRCGHILILHVTEESEFRQWRTIETKIAEDLRRQAESFLTGIARIVNESTGMIPGIEIVQGDRAECIVGLIRRDPSIMALVLGSRATGSSAGPLVSHFTGKGRSALPVPLVVVPTGIEVDRLDHLV